MVTESSLGFYEIITGDTPFSRRQVKAFIDALPGVASPEQIAQMILTTLPDEYVRQFALAWFVEEIKGIEREANREAEERATEVLLTDERIRSEAERQERMAEIRDLNQERRRRYYEKLQDDPSSMFRVYKHRDKSITYNFFAPREEADFVSWLGDRYCDWYQSARAAASALGLDALNEFEKVFDELGYLDPKRAFEKALRAETERFAARIRLQVTEELLGTEFALGDGTRTTWGQANIDQHQCRIRLLLGNAQANAETAGRHAAAIRMIVDAGATCLGDLAPKAA